MLEINIDELNEIEEILEGYTNKLNKLTPSSEDYRKLKEHLDNKFCGLNLFSESQVTLAELDLGNVIIEDDILTCIYDNRIHKFKMVKRKACNGEQVYIVNATEQDAFNTKYRNRCFKIHGQPTKYSSNSKPHVLVKWEGEEYGWCLYDHQYVVLEEIQEVA
jgi:hypothetical protein